MTKPQQIDIQEAVQLRELGCTFSEIAKKLNCTRQGISKVLKKARKLGLHNNEQGENF